MVDQSTKTHQKARQWTHPDTLLSLFAVSPGHLRPVRNQNNSLTVSTDRQRGTKGSNSLCPTRDPSPFTINVLDTGATDGKKKKKIDSQRHWSTSYRRTQNDFICVCKFTFKVAAWQALQLIVTVSQLPSKQNLSKQRGDAPVISRGSSVPPDFGRPGMTPRPPAQFTDQLLQTWMLLDMATFELEKFNTKKCLVQSRFYFFF